MPDTPEPDGRSRRWDDHKQERRARILDAAVAVLHDEGDVAGVKDIADRAGVPRSVVYRLFKDREDLDEQVRERIVDDLLTALAPTLAPRGTVEDAIRTAVDTYVGWIVANPNLHTFLGTGSARRRTIGSRVVTSTRTAIAAQVAGLIAGQLTGAGADERYAEPLAFAMMGMVDATVNRWLSKSLQPLDAAELSEFLQVSAWQILHANLRRIGVELDPNTRVGELRAAAGPESA
ncbi:TetR/AcrR family transcriptional regulator [Gordonia sinesedis]